MQACNRVGIGQANLDLLHVIAYALLMRRRNPGTPMPPETQAVQAAAPCMQTATPCFAGTLLSLENPAAKLSCHPLMALAEMPVSQAASVPPHVTCACACAELPGLHLCVCAQGGLGLLRGFVNYCGFDGDGDLPPRKDTHLWADEEMVRAARTQPAILRIHPATPCSRGYKPMCAGRRAAQGQPGGPQRPLAVVVRVRRAAPPRAGHHQGRRAGPRLRLPRAGMYHACIYDAYAAHMPCELCMCMCMCMCMCTCMCMCMCMCTCMRTMHVHVHVHVHVMHMCMCIYRRSCVSC